MRPLPSIFLEVQTFLVCAFSVWSFGGRAEGAISGIIFLSLFCLPILLTHPGWNRALAGPKGKAPLAAGWIILSLILIIGSLNPSVSPVFDPASGSMALETNDPISWLPSAFVAERSRLYAGLLGAAMLQSLAIWHVCRTRTGLRRMIAVIGANAVVAALVGLGFKMGGATHILGIAEPVHPEFFGPFRYHNHWTAFALLSLFQCAAIAIYFWRQDRMRSVDRDRGLHLAWTAAAVLLAISLAVTGARLGVIFLVLAGVLAFGIYAVFSIRRRGGSIRYLRSWKVLLPGAAILVGAGGLVLFLAKDQLSKTIEETRSSIESLDESGISGFERPRLMGAWSETGQLIAQRPVFGWGPGSFLYTFYLVAGDDYRDETGQVFVKKEFAHNDWLQYLAELGIVGFAALVVPPVLLGLRVFRQGPASEFSVWLLGGCGLVLLLALIEFPLSNPAVLMLFFLQVAVALRYQSLEALLRQGNTTGGGRT